MNTHTHLLNPYYDQVPSTFSSHFTLLDSLFQAKSNLSPIFFRPSHPKTGHYSSPRHPKTTVRLPHLLVIIIYRRYCWGSQVHDHCPYDHGQTYLQYPRHATSTWRRLNGATPRSKALAPGPTSAAPAPSRQPGPALERELHSPGAPSSLAPSSLCRRCPCPGSPGTRSGAAGCACGGAALPPASSSGAWET